MGFCNCDADVIYDYYKDIKNRANNDGTDLNMNSRNLSRVLCYFCIDYFEKNKSPIVVPDNVYDASNAIEVYHGFKDYKHGANLIWDYMYHYGEGVWGSGVYTTDNINEAHHYTRDCGVLNYDRILKMKLYTDEIVDYSVIRDAILNLMNKERKGIVPYPALDEQKQKKFEELRNFFDKVDDHDFKVHFLSNPATIGAYLGFDVVVKPGESRRQSTHYLILNRSKILLPLSITKKFMENAGGRYEGLGFALDNVTQEK